jgi:hypothetical protein
LLETAEKGLEEAKEKKGLEVVSTLSMACEHAFHSYVWLCETILRSHGMIAYSHEDRRQIRMGRKDLAYTYSHLKDVLHTEGYYERKFSELQEDAIKLVRRVLEREFPREIRDYPSTTPF